MRERNVVYQFKPVRFVATGPNGDHFQRDHRDPGPYAEKVHAVVILGNDHDRA
jgi:hypothetical protein